MKINNCDPLGQWFPPLGNPCALELQLTEDVSTSSADQDFWEVQE